MTGIYYHPRRLHYQARITAPGHGRVYLGTYPTQDDAADAREAAERLLADGVPPSRLLSGIRAGRVPTSRP
jgi:hypothetical protein